jgi:HK97 family phage prohead protease
MKFTQRAGENRTMSYGNKKEMRFASEIRADASGSGKKLSGYASVYGVEAKIGDMFREVIMPGAFDMCLSSDPDVRCLWNHDDNVILGRTSSGTLRLKSDKRGLFYEVDLPNTQAANDLWESVKRGDVSQSSFGFTCSSETWETPSKPGELALRKVEAADVFDVSPVAFPAYEAASVNARSLFPEGFPDGIEKRSGVEKYLPGKESDSLEVRLMIARMFHGN